ncbi:MAG TPA: M13 family metallopeptidase N-terminal domain-containing protein, partial [Rhizomicrobium sp.]
MRRAFLAAVFLSGAALAATNVDPGFMDKSVRPGDDFFAYANGRWARHAVIPPDRSYAGVNLEIDERNEARLKGIMAALAASADSTLTSEERKLRDFYAAYMDVKRIDAVGLAPAAADLARIAALASPSDVARAMGDPSLALDGPFAMSIDTDNKHPGHYAVHLGQSGLGMPDRDYYMTTGKDIAAARVAYRKYIAAMLALAGIKDAARADAVYALEKKLAAASWAAEDRRDEDKTYNPMTLAALEKFAPQFPWG